jgi:FMN-dependent NADH-azoreductase
MDRMTAQVKRADIVVLAFPMYNFSLPAAVKAWFDSVMQKGETWTGADGGYRGLMQGKKALILMASGGAYNGKMASWEHAVSLAKVEFTFMGFDEVKAVTAEDLNRDPDGAERRLAAAQERVRLLAREWTRQLKAASTALTSAA